MPGSPSVAKADYGLDAPGQLRTFAIRGAVLLVIAYVMTLTNPGSANPLIVIAAAAGAAYLLTAGIMWWSSRFAKLRLRDTILDYLPWRGDERILDVGCGRGMMLIGAAKRAPKGRAFGVDIWRQEDQKHNSSQATMANAKAEGVADRVKLESADARKLPFPDGNFDIVVSSLALHNIPNKEGRTKALEEIVRVLKSGGRLAILDIFHTSAYAEVLRSLGLIDVEVSGLSLLWCVPTRYLTARKP